MAEAICLLRLYLDHSGHKAYLNLYFHTYSSLSFLQAPSAIYLEMALFMGLVEALGGEVFTIKIATTKVFE